MRLAQELLINIWYNDGSSFAEETRALKMRSVVANHPSEVDNNQLRTIIETDPLTTTWDVAKELNINHCMVFGIWSKLERWKSLISG